MSRLRSLLPVLLIVLPVLGASAGCGGCEEPVRCSQTDFCPEATRCEDDVCVPVEQPLPIDLTQDATPDSDGVDVGVDVGDDIDDEPADAGTPTDPADTTDPTETTDPTGGVDAGSPGAPDAGSAAEREDAGTPGDPSTGPTCAATAERCSFVDEDCDGLNNEGLDCTFVASSNEALWRVDPFAAVVTALGPVTRNGAEVLFDIDEAPDGALLATAGRSLYRIEPTGALTALVLGRLPFNPNGLAVDADGAVYVSNHDPLVGSKIVSAASPSQVPAFFTSLGELDSSGDCVRHKTTLLLTVVGPGGDRLARVDLVTGDVFVVGDLPVAGVMGLSSAFGELFGLTGAGEVLRIDDTDASAELLFDVDVRFTGAASAPGR